MTGVSVSLWVKAEPFSYGALPVAPHPRLNFSNIKKIVIYAKNKGETGFPFLSYSVWKHIACNKLHLTEDLAWMYFSSCHLLCDSVDSAERIQWDKKFAESISRTKPDSLRMKLSVDTYKMVLYLYIQQLYRVSLRASLVAGDEWPTQSSNDSDGRSTPRGTKSMDDHSHLVFVQNHLGEMLELLAEPDSMPRFGSSLSGSLSLAAVEALDCLIAGSLDKFKSLLPLQDIAAMPVMHVHSGYSKGSKTFSVRIFQAWVKDYLTQNPFGVSACIASGVRLSWPFEGDDSKTDMSSTKRGKIASNARIVPKANIKGNKMIIMSQVGKQTVARSSGTLEMSCVKIHRCHYSFLYLLSPLRSVTIEKCRYSTIILGPVETCIHFSNCESVTLIACCRNVMVSGCTLCTLHLMTPTRPLLLSGNDTLLLAPYHTHYPHLEEHMANVGLTEVLNMWDQPLCVGPDHRDDLPIWELMPVQEFFTFNIPFEMTGPTHSIPGGLPSRYLRASSQRQKVIDRWQKMVKDAGLTRDQRKEFQSLVETRFHIWLAETGHKREVDSLVVPLQTTSSKK